MIKDEDAYRVHLNAGFGQPPETSRSRAQDPELTRSTPFCLGILGDFSGKSHQVRSAEHGSSSLWPLARVTPENVLSFAGLSPVLRVVHEEGASEPEELALATFDDFHPDQLFERLAFLEPVRRTRRVLVGGKYVPEEGPKDHPENEPDPTQANVLDSILDETQREIATQAPDLEDDLDGFIRRVVRPHVISSDPNRASKLAGLDSLASDTLKKVIQDPGFVALESLWRSVVFLLSQFPVSTRLRVYLVDLPKSALVDDLLRTDEPTEWGLGSLFLDPVSENDEKLRWAGLIGAYSFGEDPEDIPLLQRIGLLSEASEVPWFSGGDAALLGCKSLAHTPEPRDWTDSIDPLWIQLRQNPEASWISLALPEYLLAAGFHPQRGRSGRFSFTDPPNTPARLLWGNPAFLAGIGLGRMFSDSGWSMSFPGHVSFENVPNEPPEGDQVIPTRFPLSHSAAAQVRESGLTAVLGFRDRPTLRLEGFRSISAHGGSVKAWWMEGG